MLSLEGRDYSSVSTFFNVEQGAWVLKDGVLRGPLLSPSYSSLRSGFGKEAHILSSLGVYWLALVVMKLTVSPRVEALSPYNY